LIEALEELGHTVQENKVLVVNGSHAQNHPTVNAEIAITNDIGFKWNNETKSYELVAELDTWDLDVPVNRFIDKVTQQYAVKTIVKEIEEENFQITHQTQNNEGVIELVCTRWN
tara:strand:- start:3 stop:344 length:342 start_codon:yes stop_codon:yes gene_type:complete